MTYAELTLPRGGRGASSSSSSSVPPPPLLCAARRPPPPPLHSSSSASTSASSAAPAAGEQPVVYARINHSCPSKQPLAPLVRVKSPPPSMLQQPPTFFRHLRPQPEPPNCCDIFVGNFTGVFCLLALSLSCIFTFFQSVHLLIFFSPFQVITTTTAASTNSGVGLPKSASASDDGASPSSLLNTSCDSSSNGSGGGGANHGHHHRHGHLGGGGGGGGGHNAGGSSDEGFQVINNSERAVSLPYRTSAVCPDFFLENAQGIAQNARKKAPAKNVSFFAFLNASRVFQLFGFFKLFFEILFLSNYTT